jgi:hypothetical protein
MAIGMHQWRDGSLCKMPIHKSSPPSSGQHVLHTSSMYSKNAACMRQRSQSSCPAHAAMACAAGKCAFKSQDAVKGGSQREEDQGAGHRGREQELLEGESAGVMKGRGDGKRSRMGGG